MIARKIRVRYREPGDLRLQLPERFRRPEIAPLLKKRLSKVEGIYRVDYWRSGKLVIRYHAFLLPERGGAAGPGRSGEPSRASRWRERW